MHWLRGWRPETTLTRKNLWKLLLAVGVAAVGVSAAEAQSFTAELSSRKVAYGATEPIGLQLKIRNVSSAEVALLSWKLPFGEIEDDIFVVTCGGKRAPYIGRVYKRAAPTAADYVRIPPSKELSGTFDLAGSYAIDEGGDCTVQFQFKLANIHAKGRDTVAGTLSGRDTSSGTVTSERLFMILDPRPRPKDAAIEGPRLEVFDGAAVEMPVAQSSEDAPSEEPLTLTPEEEAAAAEELLSVLQEEAASQGAVEEPQEPLSEGAAAAEPFALGPAYRSCSATRQTQIKTALTSAQSYATGAYNFLASNPRSTARYTRWFGKFTTTRHSFVKGHYSRMKNAMASKRFTFDCNCSKPGVFAYVYANRPYQIWLCPVFWRSPNTGRDSKAGTLVHEASHFDIIGNTDDWVYGVYDSRWLALYYPDLAIRNADSHSYFVELK